MKQLPYRLSVCGKDEVENYADASVTHLLSLEDPHIAKTTPSWFRGIHVQLQFHDVESLADALAWGAVAPTRSDVAEILKFGKECLATSRRQPVHLLVHCQVGASRSPAAGFALVAQAFGRGRSREALKQLLQLRPVAAPNVLIVRFADELLGRRGELLRALVPLRHDIARYIERWTARSARSPKRKRT